MELDPCIPKTWPRFELTVRHGSSRYEIVVENPGGVSHGVVTAQLDGHEVLDRPLRAPLQDDGATHTLHVRLGSVLPTAHG